MMYPSIFKTIKQHLVFSYKIYVERYLGGWNLPSLEEEIKHFIHLRQVTKAIGKDKDILVAYELNNVALLRERGAPF